MLTAEFAQRFAAEWEAAWNAHDLARVLAHYADDFEMISPFIVAMAGEASGTLKGKDKVGAYWKSALAKLPDLRFEVIDVFYGVNSLVIYYKAVMGKRGAEIMFFDGRGKVSKSIAHYNRP
jgi:ketosteroid isomerase-like protein